MFGFKYIQFDSMTYVIQYVGGKLAKEGKGLAFFYYAPRTSIAAIPMGSNDLPFIFTAATSDYQSITIQGQVTYKISDPKQLAEVLDFTVNMNGIYKKNDIEKLNQRIINESQTSTSSFISSIDMKSSLRSSKEVEQKIREGLKISKAIAMLGIEILGVNILAIKASPEMERALETETREKLQQEADQAIYLRRNFAVEQERKIKESELNTEIAVEEKKKQISEKQMESKVQASENERKLREMTMLADISVEEQRKRLIDLKTDNERKEADTKGYVIQTTLQPYKEMDWKLLMALSGNTSPAANVAIAFRELSENANKIGNLNISPDLLQGLLDH